MATKKEIKTLSLLNKRVTRLDEILRLIGNLSNKQHYSLSTDKLNELEDYLNSQVASTIDRLRENKIGNFTFEIRGQ
jgi:hypothetical protein